jgi:hypothetical protein
MTQCSIEFKGAQARPLNRSAVIIAKNPPAQ